MKSMDTGLRVIVVGSREFVEVYGIQGVKRVVITDPLEFMMKLREIVNERYVSMILVEEKFLDEFRDEIKRLKLDHPLPLIVGMPGP